MAKTMDDLAESREERQRIINKYGFIPKSIFDVKYQGQEHIIDVEKTQQKVAVDLMKGRTGEAKVHEYLIVMKKA